MNRTALTAALVLTLGFASTAAAQPMTKGVVLMVEDDGRPEVSVRTGVALYGRFLRAGAYQRIKTVTGRENANQRLAAAIVEVAEHSGVVDVFLSVHTTYRTADELQALIPPAVRSKLRLVYSTACYGNDYEREAWESVGARTVITHVGLNNPLIALPYFLSSWIGGGQVDDAVTMAYSETRRASTYILSLPGMPSASSLGSNDPVAGSRPVVSGDRNLTIMSGLPRHPVPVTPEALTYQPRRGGGPGLILRALIGHKVERSEIRALLNTLDLSQFPFPAGNLDKIKRVKVERHESGDGQLVIELDKKVRFPLEQGLKLQLSKRVVIRPGVFDANSRKLKLHMSGVWIKKGILGARLSEATLQPSKPYGYEVKARVGLLGFIPYTHTLRIGGSTPYDANADLGPIFRPTPAEGVGISGALSGAVSGSGH